MFNKLKEAQQKLHMPHYFGRQKISSFGFVPRYDEEKKEMVEADDQCKVWVIYDDGSRESMTAEEWKLASELPLAPEVLQDFNRKRLTVTVIPSILDVMQKHNIRLGDVEEISKIVMNSLDNYINVAHEISYGSSRFHDWTIKKVEELTSFYGMAYKKMEGNPLGQMIWDALMSDPEQTLESVYRAIIYVNNSFNAYADNAKSASMGVAKHTVRVSDLMQTIKKGEDSNSKALKNENPQSQEPAGVSSDEQAGTTDGDVQQPQGGIESPTANEERTSGSGSEANAGTVPEESSKQS